MDAEVAKLLRKVTKPILVAVNKVDNGQREKDAVEFYNLGLGEYFTIAGMSGSGTGELLDKLVEVLPELPDVVEEENPLPRFTVVGRPNAGKSSFINALIGEDRFVVTDIAGTTRDAIDTTYNRFGFEFKLVDTAGIRRKAKVKEDLEFYSVMRSVRAIEHSDVCILMIDATRGFEGQDQSIFWLAEKNRKGIVILVNKWDLIEKDTMSTRDYERKIREELQPFTDVPILFVSALTKQRLLKALETAVEVFENRKQRIATSKFNETMLPIIEHHPPPALKGKYVKIKFCMQLPTPTPQFVFFANLPQYVKDPYKRYLENKLREHYNFSGVPIDIYFRQK
jgi:GTP-binding protein